ncbi:MAG: TIGR03960 family B12-binding radical SAM protein [Clostridia bacterium]|nr:TIGR03960 family B12-binding radical SAM protein [Clostridia bacterium]
MRIPESILKKVEKPGRYVGGEWGQIIKDKKDVDVRFAFCFPDTYEIGMSNLGIRILYDIMNKMDGVWCERAYAPWVDMEKEMREHDIPLWAVESGDPLADFDIVGFTLQYEMCYTNVLNMLDLAGIPLMAAERKKSDPLVVFGGPCTYNGEPVADFADIMLIGEGEDEVVELCLLFREYKHSDMTKEEFLHRAAQIEGFYVPSLYDVQYNDDGTIKSYTPKYGDIPTKVRKRIVRDMDKAPYPENLVMPYIETVQDRVVLEVYRGCIRGCRFCQAGMVYRPVREKTVERLNEAAKKLIDNTGYDEITLSSLSISDYTCIDKLTTEMLKWTDERNISLSLPSLRVNSFTKELMDKISTIRTGGITFAPEAGTQRLRDVINKNINEEELLRACRVAFSGGKTAVKLYFMQGLPTETDEDLDGIIALAREVIEEFYRTPDRVKRQPQVTISAACFVPKPFTPFQWEGQCDYDELCRRQKYVTVKNTDRKIKYNYHDAGTSRIEAVFARGDRRLCKALIEAHNRGMRLDSWEEFFSYEGWLDVFRAVGIDESFYANRTFGEDEVLPWDIIDIGVTKEFFLRERHNAYKEKTTPACSEHCSGCGANRLGGERTWCPKNAITSE